MEDMQKVYKIFIDIDKYDNNTFFLYDFETDLSLIDKNQLSVILNNHVQYCITDNFLEN